MAVAGVVRRSSTNVRCTVVNENGAATGARVEVDEVVDELAVVVDDEPVAVVVVEVESSGDDAIDGLSVPEQPAATSPNAMTVAATRRTVSDGRGT